GGPRLVVTVADDGVGLPADFDVESSNSLGLQIVRTLIVGELGGRLKFGRRAGGGTEVLVDIPLEQAGARAPAPGDRGVAARPALKDLSAGRRRDGGRSPLSGRPDQGV